MSIFPPKFIRFCTFAFVALALACAQAATYTWDGGGTNNNWTTAANWDVGTPASGADVIFAGSTRLNVNDSWGTALSSISFASGAGAFVLSGGGHDIGAGGITNDSSNTQTLNSQYTLSANQVWNANTGAIVIGTNYFNGNSKNLTLNGSSAITMGGQIGNLGALTLSGSGNRTFSSSVAATSVAINNTGTNTFTGQINASTSITASAGTTNFGAISLSGSGGVNVNGSASVNFNGAVNPGSGGIHIDTTGNVVFNSTINSGTLTLDNGHVTISGTGNSSLDSATVNGGTLVLDQSGGRALIHDLVVNDGGTVIFSGDDQIPDGGTTITLNEGSTLFLGNSSQTVQDLIINGDSVIDFGSSGSQLNIEGDITISDDITITILNWNEEIGDVFAGANPGDDVVVTIQYADNEGNIYASGTWGGGEITPGSPIPEPAACGFLLLGGGIGFVLTRRRMSRHVRRGPA